MMNRRFPYRARMFLAAAVLCTAAQGLRAQGTHGNSAYDPAARHAWITNAIAIMRIAEPGPDSNLIDIYDLKHFEKNQLSSKLYANAFIKLSEDQWIYILLTSSHQHPAVGDLLLAMTQDGEVYYSEAHVCGGTSTFRSDDLIMPETSVEYLTKFHSRDRSRVPWIKFDLEAEPDAKPN